MSWFQKKITLKKRDRGFHIITDEILQQISEISDYKSGIINIFIMHTSASITINENADFTVREDFESHFNQYVPENAPYYKHTLEGSDDMPAHIKASIIGNNITLPITDGNLALGTWQGIYLCEHRNHGGPRTLVITIWGEEFLQPSKELN